MINKRVLYGELADLFFSFSDPAHENLKLRLFLLLNRLPVAYLADLVGTIA